MENQIEKQPTFKIEAPRVGDEIELAPMHIQAWKETYVAQSSDVTEEMVDEMLGHMLTNTDFRKNTISESLSNPDKVFYRVVRNARGDIVGFFHGSKHEEYNMLDAIYMLNEAKGTGVSGKLMDEFLAWIDTDKPCKLEVFSFNDHAISFYEKYGFVKVDKPAELYKGRKELPFIEMVRESQK